MVVFVGYADKKSEPKLAFFAVSYDYLRRLP
jgi:hypothetical protein